MQSLTAFTRGARWLPELRAGCISLAVLAVGITGGCRSKKGARDRGESQAGAPVKVQLTCGGDDIRELVVTADVALDTQLCDDEWDAIDVVSPGRVNMLKVIDGRELWLRGAGGRAFVEVRFRGKVTESVDRVSALQIHPVNAAVARTDTIEITHGGTTEKLDVRALRQRFTEHGVRQASLCAIADSFGGASVATITVYGDQPEPLVVSRKECDERGLIVKFSGQGAVRLRQRDGTRIFGAISRIQM
jgi:hypothetical protein